MPRKTLSHRNPGRVQTQLEAMLHKVAERTNELTPRMTALNALRVLTNLRGQVDRATLAAMKQARAEGASWGDIAGPMKTSAQAAQQRLARSIGPAV